MKMINPKENVRIGSTVCDCKDFITKLSKIKSSKKCHRLLKHSSRNELLALAEICLNIVSSNFPLTTRQKKRLMPHAGFIRKMARMRSEKGARKLVVQQGSGAPAVFAALLTPILIDLAQKLIKGENK
jgi:hypothetical protein